MEQRIQHLLGAPRVHRPNQRHDHDGIADWNERRREFFQRGLLRQDDLLLNLSLAYSLLSLFPVGNIDQNAAEDDLVAIVAPRSGGALKPVDTLVGKDIAPLKLPRNKLFDDGDY